jgi:hypothetical protein
MTNDQQAVTAEQPAWRCHFCGTTEGMISPDICQQCLRRILLKQVPRLRRLLESKYGDIIDRWLSTYRLRQSFWEVTPEFEIRTELIQRFLSEIVREGVEGYEVGLNLTANDLWQPISIDELVDYLSEKCVAEIGHYLRQVLTAAIPTDPTLNAERELIEVIIGKKRVKRYRRDEAVWRLTASRAIPFKLPLNRSLLTLIEMHYQSDQALSFYFDADEGVIDEVWRLVEDSLPEEVLKLIALEESD